MHGFSIKLKVNADSLFLDRTQTMINIRLGLKNKIKRVKNFLIFLRLLRLCMSILGKLFFSNTVSVDNVLSTKKRRVCGSLGDLFKGVRSKLISQLIRPIAHITYSDAMLRERGKNIKLLFCIDRLDLVSKDEHSDCFYLKQDRTSLIVAPIPPGRLSTTGRSTWTSKH